MARSAQWPEQKEISRGLHAGVCQKAFDRIGSRNGTRETFIIEIYKFFIESFVDFLLLATIIQLLMGWVAFCGARTILDLVRQTQLPCAHEAACFLSKAQNIAAKRFFQMTYPRCGREINGNFCSECGFQANAPEQHPGSWQVAQQGSYVSAHATPPYQQPVIVINNTNANFNANMHSGFPTVSSKSRLVAALLIPRRFWRSSFLCRENRNRVYLAIYGGHLWYWCFH